jgi:hypothetical protein
VHFNIFPCTFFCHFFKSFFLDLLYNSEELRSQARRESITIVTLKWVGGLSRIALISDAVKSGCPLPARLQLVIEAETTFVLHNRVGSAWARLLIRVKDSCL